ncbi:MAG: hypothetical protein JNL66_17905 [Alphaproteobacteria bacterium]|nr:hypothetical protein [Alphaproteobacteria bacterium]
MPKLWLICAGGFVAAALAGAAARADDKRPVAMMLDSVTYNGPIAQVPVTILNLSGGPLAAQDIVCDFMSRGGVAGRGWQALPGIGAGGRAVDIVSADVGGSAIDAVRCEMTASGAARGMTRYDEPWRGPGVMRPFIK